MTEPKTIRDIGNRLFDARSQIWALKLMGLGLRDGQSIDESEREPYANAFIAFADQLQEQFGSVQDELDLLNSQMEKAEKLANTA